MFEIFNKQILSEDVKRIDIFAPNIAKKVQPGQFVSVSPEEGDEKIPLSVIEWDANKGTITLIFQEVGSTTGKLGTLPINESIFSVLGPLGKPSEITKVGTVVCIATGMGEAQILPVARALKKAGNKVIGIIGAKKKKNILLEAQMRLASNQMYIATEDGSFERRGMATDILKDIIKKEKIDLIYAVGTVDMMEAVSQIAKEKNINARVQLKPVMVDCMGMCGSCRVKVGDEIVLGCIKGPEFDAERIDFTDYKSRIKSFNQEIKR